MVHSLWLNLTGTAVPLRRAVLRYIWCLLADCRLPAGKYTGILTHFQTKVNKKTDKKNSPQRTQKTQRFYLFLLTAFY